MSDTELRAALIEARDWFESQAKAVSKGCGSSYELHDLREQRDALDAALDAPAQAAPANEALKNAALPWPWKTDAEVLDDAISAIEGQNRLKAALRSIAARTTPAASPAQAGGLSEQDCGLLEQAASMLDALANDERNRGNCSTAEGADCSAYVVRRLASALLASAPAQPSQYGSPELQALVLARCVEKLAPAQPVAVGMEPVAGKSHGAWDGIEEVLDMPNGTELFTAAQVQTMLAAAARDSEPTELQLIAITTAYEQGVGKGHQAHASGKETTNPYSNGWRCDQAWKFGYDEGKQQAQHIAAAPTQAAPEDLSVAYFMGLHAAKRAPQPPAQPPAQAQEARQPLTDAQIASACMSYRHDFGLLDDANKAQLMDDAREWERALGKEHARATK